MVTTTTESSPSSRLRFFNENAVEIPSPVEGGSCGIVIDIPKDFWQHISLRSGTYSLPISFDEGAFLAYAMWPPCGPGYYELALECGDYRERRTFTVMPRYFTESDLTSMVHELKELLPKSIASQLLECGGQLGTKPAVDAKSGLENEYLKLRNAIAGTKERPGLLQILPNISRECHQVLIPRTEIRDANKVRRPDITKIPQIMSMPGNVLTVNKVYRMFDVTVEHSYDTYENQLVKQYVQALRSRLSRLQPLVPPAMARELETMIAEFNLACARATFLREVKLPSTFVNRITMVLLKNHSYRAVFEDYLALNQESTSSSVTLEESALSNPLTEFPFLYELWANLRVLNSLLQVCVESGFRCVSHNWVKKYNKGIFIRVMNDSQAAIEMLCPTTGRQVTLVTWRPQGGSETLADTPNRERLMALAIVIDTPGKNSQILLFDPEYRVSPKSSDKAAKKGKKPNRKKTLKTVTARAAATRPNAKAAKSEPEELSNIEPMKEDIDELVRCIDMVKTPDGVNRIQYAAILYPGHRMEVASNVEALSALPSDGDGLQKAICDVLRRYLA